METLPSDSAAFNAIANDYQESKLLPFRVHLEKYTLFKLLGDLQGKDVLDLACGEGIYTREIKKLGAGRVLGKDISPNMIALAREAELKNPQGVQYEVGDAAEYVNMGEFHVVLAAYLLNYATSKEHLAQFARSIYPSLRPGGRLVGINDYPANQVEFYSTYRKYGFIKSTPSSDSGESGERKEGSPITYTFFRNDGSPFHFENYFLDIQIYERTFKEVGFKEFTWCPLELSPTGRQAMGDDYWKEFLAHPPLVCFTASK